jgi:hypothetical protein
MKYLVIGRPGTVTIKLKHGAALFQAAKDWVNAKLEDGTIECHYGFADLGGFTIANVDSHEKVQEMILQYPLYPFFEWEVAVLCDWEHTYDKNIEYFKKFAR